MKASIATSDKKKAKPSTPRTATPRSRSTRKAAALSPEQLHGMIAEEAWLRAERRGFVGGDPVSDWLAAEQDVTRRLAGASRQRD